ncbi:MAG: DUF2806 domain-containing protein [Nitrosospira sp.]
MFTLLQQSGFQRLIYQEGKKQENIESITAQAAAMLPDHAQVEDLDEDWIANFFKQCDTVSNKEMQSLWAKLLSGEATRSGTFSKRAINLVSSIGKSEADLFTDLCQFNWVFDDGKDIIPLIYDVGMASTKIKVLRIFHYYTSKLLA